MSELERHHPDGAAPYGVVPVAGHLASEEIIVSAPLSFAGSTRRIWRAFLPGIRRGGWRGAAWRALLVITLLLAWIGVLVWYVIFGLWLIPYRIVRRVQRHGKRKALRHRELLGRGQGS